MTTSGDTGMLPSGPRILSPTHRTMPMPSPDAPRFLPLLGWLTGAVFFFYAWVLRVAPSVMVEELMRDLAVGGAVLGHVSGAYYYGYAGMQVPVGVLLDRFGPRRLMTAASLVCAAGGVLFAMGSTLGAVTIGRLLIGASAAFSLVGAMAVAGQWFPASRFAVLSGGAMAMGMAGGVFGQAPVRLAVEAWSWRATTLALAAGGVLLAAAAWSTVRDRRRGHGGVAEVLLGLGAVARRPETWLVAVGGLGTAAPLLGFAGLWGVPFLEVAYGLPRASAATVTSMLFVGWGVGAPILGWLSDRVGRRKAPLVAGLTLQMFALATLVWVPGLPVLALAGLCFLVGVLGSAQIVGFALVREANPAHLSGTAIGFVNAMVTGAGALFQPLVGFLLDLAWTGQTALGARVYTPGAYRLAFASLVGCCLCGVLCVLAVRETFCRPRA
jgi:MFS family permease